jgi:hypothetical protein
LTQTGEELHTGIAIGRLDAEFALVIEHGKARRVADPAIGAAGVEAERSKAALKFLDLGEGRRRLAVGKLLDEGRTADASIAEIAKTERVTHCRIVAARGKKIPAQKESRPAATGSQARALAFGCGKGLPSARATPSAACHLA